MAGVQERQVLLIDALARLHRHRDAVRLGGLHRGKQDLAQQRGFPRQRCSAALSRDFRDRTTEVQVDVCHPMVAAQDRHRFTDVARIDAVELD